MSNIWDDVHRAIVDAKDTTRAADDVACDMASLLRGRLRKVNNHYVLVALKRELASYNVATKEWKP